MEVSACWKHVCIHALRYVETSGRSLLGRAYSGVLDAG